MQNIEELGIFYLGKIFNLEKRERVDLPLTLDAKDLTTHAVLLGMTGSGKTGLGVTLIEEAAIDSIPAIVIDPKGDLGNLLLNFPNLSAAEFAPWVDQAEAKRKGFEKEAYAQEVAKKWKEGLASWGQGTERIKKLKQAVEMTIYTPASNAGIPLSVLNSFEAPPEEIRFEPAAMRERVMSITSSLLGLLGIDADPVQSREHVLISCILGNAWQQGNGLDLATLIHQVQNPPFDQIGALGVDTFISKKERQKLSIRINSLLASPSFQAWMAGDPLDISGLLYTEEGKPKLSVISIAHLSDEERMFFVTLFLNELLSWMRKQPGTSSLRCLLYMDEIFGYFPPSAMPPSKIPMLTLLKQARAYGLGVVLATQNPVDLDYKGLANCGTWFIGKLQTAQDKAKVAEGLRIAGEEGIDQLLDATGKRVFVMKSIHEKNPVMFETRWTMSYLRGPLTLAQIAKLKKVKDTAKKTIFEQKLSKPYAKPQLPADIEEYFLRAETVLQQVHYRPLIGAFAELHYVDRRRHVDTWKKICLVSKDGDWDRGEELSDFDQKIRGEAVEDATFGKLPAGLVHKDLVLSLTRSLYQHQSLEMYKFSKLKLLSEAGESEQAFRVRVAQALREQRDEEVKKLRQKYQKKISALNEKLDRTRDDLTAQREQARIKTTETFFSIGSTLVGALFGRRITKGTVREAGQSMRGWSQTKKKSLDIQRLEEKYQDLEHQLFTLEKELREQVQELTAVVDPSTLELENSTIMPRKPDIHVDKVFCLWCPVHQSASS